MHSGEQARNTLKIEQYRAMIVAQIEELKAIGLEEIDGEFYFHNMKGMAFWPIVNKKQLMNFPSSAFNRQYHISNTQGIIQKPKQRAKLFHILDLPIDEALLAEIQNEK